MKGKHANQSIRHREQILKDEIDRLTDRLADAKARSRIVERDAALVPELRQQIQKQREQLDANTSQQLENVRQDAQSDIDAIKHQYDKLAEVVVDVLNNEDRELSNFQLGALQELIGLENIFRGEFSQSRTQRHNMRNMNGAELANFLKDCHRITSKRRFVQ